MHPDVISESSPSDMIACTFRISRNPEKQIHFKITSQKTIRFKNVVDILKVIHISPNDDSGQHASALDMIACTFHIPRNPEKQIILKSVVERKSGCIFFVEVSKV